MGVKESSRLILLGETWPEQEAVGGGGAYVAESVFGFFKRPGERFGAGAGMDWSVGRFGVRASQITWYRHRTKARASVTEPVGRVNFAFVDGHVERLGQEEVADAGTGRSTMRVLWSLGDAVVDAAPQQPGF